MNEKYIPELLAPAGEPSAAYGAFSAGADAVYLGASYSARAYAKNFEKEELIDLIHYAHLFGKKVYLASNILMKEQELFAAVEEIGDFYKEGLDGVIVQDLGLIQILHQTYPNLPLHASTQMTVLSSLGSEYLRNYGICRVVPGRELSVRELSAIKATGIEVEAFIHGAMCYSYSGKCLFSSIAGGRSGNRGRCAGPCRQPYYTANGKECYPISMKDMCGLSVLTSLLDAKIDSFKIEGRMKSPSYSAGVTEIYRKYIDAYLEHGEINISKSDYTRLEGLYLRSERQEGYFFMHNGESMISLDSPAYNKTNDSLIESLKQKYIMNPVKKDVDLVVSAYPGAPLSITASAGEETITATSDIELEYAKNPSDVSENIKKHVSKLGDTNFTVRNLDIYAEEQVFLPVSVLKEVRRNVLSQLEETLRKKSMPYEPVIRPYENSSSLLKSNPSIKEPVILCGILTEKQFNVLSNVEQVDGFIVSLFDVSDTLLASIMQSGKKCFLRIPEILREAQSKKIETEFHRLLSKYSFSGYYAESICGLAFLKKQVPDAEIHIGNGLYAMNSVSAALLKQEGSSYSIPYELNEKEIKHLLVSDAEMMVYGYLPLMQSANCLQKTLKCCNQADTTYEIKDKDGRVFSSYMHHSLCFNTLYNNVPLSLHKVYKDIRKNRNLSIIRLEFSMENEKETRNVVERFFSDFENENMVVPNSYTTGHYKRGVL